MRAVRRVPVVLLLITMALGGCTPSSPNTEEATLTVDPTSALLDAATVVRAAGFGAGTEVTITLTATDTASVPWSSAAVYRADAQGSVDTSVEAPERGSYTGVFAGGLYAMLQPTDHRAPAFFAFPDTGAATFRLTGSGGGKEATVDQARALTGPGVTTTTLHESDHGFEAVDATPAEPERSHPAILLIGGSEGGNYGVNQARLLAAHGFEVLSIAYFGGPRPDRYPDLPTDLREIPLEYFTTALRWLRSRPGVDSNRIWTYGISRGSEAALLLGVHDRDLVHGVVASAPTDAARYALTYSDGAIRADFRHSAWSLGGRPVPWSRNYDVAAEDDPRALFAVEKINGPLVAICGGADLLWPSCDASRAMEARLAQRHSSQARALLSYLDAGHYVTTPAYLPNVPDPNGTQGQGVTSQSNPQGSADAWPKMIAFLTEH